MTKNTRTMVTPDGVFKGTDKNNPMREPRQLTRVESHSCRVKFL